MSKAFTKESDGDDEPVEERDEPLPRGPQLITKAGFAALKAERDELWSGERPRVTAQVQEAAAHGDRSDNADYRYGKKRLREIDSRLRFLTRKLDSLQIVEPSADQLGRVFFGAYVTVEDEDGVESTYRLVGTDEIDLPRRFISIASPVGQALVGKREGDTATVMRPKGPTEVTVVGIRYDLPEPAAAAPPAAEPAAPAKAAKAAKAPKSEKKPSTPAAKKPPKAASKPKKQ